MPQVQTKFSEILSWITQRHSYSLGVISTKAKLTLIKYLWHLGIEEFGLVLFKFAYLLEVLTYSDLTFSEIFSQLQEYRLISYIVENASRKMQKE